MTDVATPVLAVSALKCGYGRTEIVHGVDMEVREREIVCLIGANGAGKSTLIKGVLGRVPARSGTVRFAGIDVTNAATAARVERGLAVVPEGRGVLPRMSVKENLLMGAYVRRSDDWIAEQMDYVVGLFPILAQRRNQDAGTLSGGEQQMLVIGRALMSRPRLLILDEPSFGLAPKIVDAIFEVISGLRESGLTILLVEQNANIALEISQRGYVLEGGFCTLSDDAIRLRDNKLVRDIYLGSS